MTHTKAIKLIRTHQKLTRQAVTEKVGAKNEGGLFQRLNCPNIYINDLVDVFDRLGYQLVFQPKGKGTLPEKCYPIRLSDYDLNK